MFTDMAFLIYIYSIIPQTWSIPKESCDRLQIGEKWFERDFLWTGLGKPYNLNVHKATNTLFFSYTTPETYSDVDFQLAHYNLDTKEYEVIVGMKGGCSIAIDQANDEIYLGGSDGIYKYNMLTKIADFYKEKGVNIWTLYFKRNLFYINYPDQKLRVQVDGKFVAVKEFVNIEIDHFHMKNNDIYFANKTGLFRYYNNKTEIINHLITVRQIVEDNNGVVYICSNLGLFLLDGTGLAKILDLKNIYGLAFDKDNKIVISDEKSVIKLVESKERCMDVDGHW